MKVTTERLPNREVKLVVEMDPKRVNHALRKTARQLARQVRIPGFRPGKAPYKVMLRRFGREALLDEVLDKEGQNWYEEALEKAELEPFGQASLEVSSDEPLVLTFVLPVEPVVELGDYKEIRVDWELPEVAEEAVDEEMERLRQEEARLTPVDRPAELEDMATMDVRGHLDGETIVDMKERPITLNPEIDYPVTGFAKEVVGMVPGDDRGFTLTYPDDHANAAWAGHEVAFKVHLHSLKAWEAPEMDDQLAWDVGEYETLDEWRVAVRRDLESAALQEAEQEYVHTVVGALADQAHIEFPEAMVERELDGMMREMDQSLKQRGLGLENFLVMTGQSEEEYRESMREAAENRVLRGLALAELVEAEGLEISEEEIDAEIERMAADLGDEADKLRELFAVGEMRNSMQDNLLSQAAVDLLQEIARGEYTPPSERETEDEPAETEHESATEEAVALEPEEVHESEKEG